MILPTKGVALDRALLSIGAEILRRLDRPKTVSRLWELMRDRGSSLSGGIAYEWFSLSLDMLYMFGAVDLDDGRVRRSRRAAAGHEKASG
jgi:hypothetical protein